MFINFFKKLKERKLKREAEAWNELLKQREQKKEEAREKYRKFQTRLPDAVRKLDDEDRDNAELVLPSIKCFGISLQYVSERLRDDPEMVLEAVRANGWSLQYASERLRDNTEIVFEAIKNDIRAFRYASERLRDDREVVIQAVKISGYALEDASERLRNDRELFLEAIKDDMLRFRSSSKELRSDREVVLAAVTKNARAYTYACDPAKHDKEIITKVLNRNSFMFCYVPYDLREDPDILKACGREKPVDKAVMEMYDRLPMRSIDENSPFGKAIMDVGIDPYEYRYADEEPTTVSIDPDVGSGEYEFSNYKPVFIKLYDDKLEKLVFRHSLDILRFDPDESDQRFTEDYCNHGKPVSDPEEEARTKELFGRVSDRVNINEAKEKYNHIKKLIKKEDYVDVAKESCSAVNLCERAIFAEKDKDDLAFLSELYDLNEIALQKIKEESTERYEYYMKYYYADTTEGRKKIEEFKPTL